MLEVIANTLRPSLEVAAALSAAAVAYLEKPGREENDEASGTRPPASRYIVLLITLGIATGLGGAYLVNSRVFDPGLFDGNARIIASLGAVTLLVLVWVRAGNSTLSKALIFMGTFAVIFPRATELALLPGTVYEPGVLNSEQLLNIAGVLIGLAVAVLFGVPLARTARRFGGVEASISATLMIAVLLAQQTIVVVQFALGYGIIPVTPFLVSGLAPLIDKAALFSYGVLPAPLIFLVAYVRSRRRERREFANPAELRKDKAYQRSNRRHLVVALVTTLAIASLFAGESYAARLNKLATELSPAEPVKAIGGEVRVPTGKIDDGNLYRFSFQASDGTKVRFIAIHKGSGVYGIGLDFCDICGPAGYYQRGEDVICKNCDVVINIATIGIPGGCNPVPLEHRVLAGSVIIGASDLEAAKKKFF